MRGSWRSTAMTLFRLPGMAFEAQPPPRPGETFGHLPMNENQEDDKPPRSEGRPAPEPTQSGHEHHCFVVMPSGRESSEQKWFKGWYEVVIKPAVKEAGYEPVLAAAEEQPGAINDEIRAHLAVDPMVVVDLGGAEPEDDPNPNVMYELGIRHALGLPLVMMAWKGQRLPFDVGNQRVIMEERDLVDLDLNRKRLAAFIHAAREGRYYRPMEAVSRLATIQVASESLAEDSLLRALAQEVRALRVTMTSAVQPRGFARRADPTGDRSVKRLIRGKVFRKDLYPHFMQLGGTSQAWIRLLKTQVPAEKLREHQGWGVDEWKAFIAVTLPELMASERPPEAAQTIEEDILTQVKRMLPAQPWPPGIHKQIAEKLGITNSLASRCINELIRRGDCEDQVAGSVLHSEDATPD